MVLPEVTELLRVMAQLPVKTTKPLGKYMEASVELLPYIFTLLHYNGNCYVAFPFLYIFYN